MARNERYSRNNFVCLFTSCDSSFLFEISSSDYNIKDNPILYNYRGNFKARRGRFFPEESGYYLCNANFRVDSHSGSFMRMKIVLNGDKELQNGLEIISANGWSAWLIIE